MSANENREGVEYERRGLTLDMVGLSAAEREKGSILVGDSTKQFVQLGDGFDHGHVDTVVFEWGDQAAVAEFDQLLQADNRPEATARYLFPFAAVTLLKDELWLLAFQGKDYDPNQEYISLNNYHVLPYDLEAGVASLKEHQFQPRLRSRRLMGRVGLNWAKFEMRVKLR